MTPPEIRRLRLSHQHLLHPRLTDPVEVVRAMGPMQAQVYAMALYAVGLRTRGGSTHTEVEASFDAGEILRTHVMRPTWHFVAPQDIRMVLRATAARVQQTNAFTYRTYDLTFERRERFAQTLVELLAGGNHLTRAEIRDASREAGHQRVDESIPMAYLIMHAELEGVICSGPRRGHQFTYALMDERVPPTPELSQDEAVRELCRRYVETRGPATTKDLATWSGLTVAQVQDAVASLGDEVDLVEDDGHAYLMSAGQQPPRAGGRTSFLLPDYDEYGIAYRDRSSMIDPAHPVTLLGYDRVVLVDGMVAGGWRRTLSRDAVTVELSGLHEAADDPGVVGALRDYARFLGRELRVVVSD